MGSSPSKSSRTPINDGSSSQVLPAPTHTVGSINEEESSSLSLHEPIDSSNQSAEKKADQKHTENQARWQAEINVKEYLELLNEETNQELTMTNEEILSRKKSLLRFLNERIITIHIILRSAHEDEKWTKELYLQFVCLACFSAAVRKIGILPVDDFNKYMREAGQQLSKTRSVKAICKVVRQGWKKCSKQFLSNAIELPSNLMQQAMSVLWSFSDYSPEVTFDITAEIKFLNTLRDILTSYRQERIQGKEMTEEKSKMIGASLSIIHNLSKVDENITPLREKGFVNCVSPYLDSKTTLDRLKSLATLASLINEKESEMLQGKDELLEMFLETLGTALETPDRRCIINAEIWSAFECTLIIHRLARNQTNKQLLVQMGCLSHLTKLAKIGTIEETREAVGAIWYLAFNNDNQIKMLEDKKLNIVDLLNAIMEKTKDNTTREAASRTLRLFRTQLQNNEKNENKASAGQQSSSNIKCTEQETEHVFISYNSKHRQVLEQIRDKLQANGYTVWMDIYNMSGSTIDAMADAVENAHVVLICMSQSYEKSPDCENEAKYAYQWQKYKKRKIIVPLKMEKDYIPKGWLGFIVADDRFYDFSGKYGFKTKCDELLERIADLYSKDGSETNGATIIKENETLDAGPVSITPMSVARLNHPSSLARLKEWTQKQVNDWLDRHHLPKDVLRHLTGIDLAALIRMKDNAPETFYRYLETKLKLESLSAVETFIEALDHL